jgi:hypothetical protein
MTNIEQIQNQINALQLQLNDVKTQLYDWDTAPVICELNGQRWHLGPESPEPMAWDGAIEWCKSVGGELPPRTILLECYLNKHTEPLFEKVWYLSSTEFEVNAWKQNFFSGSQINGTKIYGGYVRAVKKLTI